MAFALWNIAFRARRFLVRRRVPVVLTLDVAVQIAAFYLAIQLRLIGEPEYLFKAFPVLLPHALLFAGAIVVSLAAVGMYHQNSRDTWVGRLARTVIAFVLGGVICMVAYYAYPDAHVGRGMLALALALGLAFNVTLRHSFTAIVSQENLKRRVMVLGAGAKASLLLSRMRRRADSHAFKLVGFVPMGSVDESIPENRRLATDCRLMQLARSLHIDEIVVAVDERRGGLPLEQLLECRTAGMAVTELTTFFEREAGKVKLGLVDPSWLIFSDGFNQSHVRLAAKRAFDIAAALAVALLASPLIVLTTLAIILESGWRAPVLYRQQRVGQGGRVFDVLKFRSMRTDAEKDGVARWASVNDDRITRVGRVIRKLRIDELPQLFNVLAGDMSLVGPRPERPHFVSELNTQIPYYGLRHCVKPGITGWAQLRYAYGASVEDAVEKLKYDMYYAKHHSLMFDALILLQTVEVVLFGKGAR